MNATHETSSPLAVSPTHPSIHSSQHLPVPAPRTPLNIRLATMADLPWMDALQKKHSKQLGYFPTKQFEGYIEMGGVLVAEEMRNDECGMMNEEQEARASSKFSTHHSPISTPRPLGYIISRDRYLKRDELGVIYQLCVSPGHQRGLIGATLVREVFQRSAYGCKLYCCWCAQDLAANYFWESMGFVPIAFRAGSDKKRRVHIFWQRRIDRDVTEYGSDGVTGYSSSDAVTDSPRHRSTPTPYWYPCNTNGGAIREDRLVFPIPPGVRWQDVEAVAMADRGSGVGCRVSGEEKKPKRLPSPTRSPNPETRTPMSTISAGGLFFGAPKPLRQSSGQPAAMEKTKRVREPKPKVKVDPALVAKARELRDRYLEQVNERMLIAPSGKYDVSRSLAPVVVEEKALPMLKAG